MLSIKNVHDVMVKECPLWRQSQRSRFYTHQRRLPVTDKAVGSAAELWEVMREYRLRVSGRDCAALLGDPNLQFVRP